MPRPARVESDGRPPARVGDFRILRKLGEGGMGVVYEAEQDNPRRSVALKVVRAALLTEEMQKRFERETHVLGLLQHPGIAQIYHAGTAGSEDGGPRPYFAMELVLGEPLTQFAREHALTVRQRLELLARVCDALQHAHQKGVVHRDLKPGNILVVIENDASSSTIAASRTTSPARLDDLARVGQPKVLDFGLARITETDLPAVTLQTEVGQILGTVQYMSPEQVVGDSARIDARSDIYALGVIGYELLCGRMPHDLRGKTALEALRTIREDDATPLSSVDRALRGDVETIVAKALEKEPERRYPTAADMAGDIRRYLRDEPIVARPASAVYQLRKFAARNRALVGGICAVFLVLVAGLIGTAMGYVEARRNETIAREKSEEARVQTEEALRSRDEATAARDQATAARDEATAARERADTAAAEAVAVNRFLVEDLLGASDPHEAKGRTITLNEVLENARAHVDDAFEDQPLLAARLRATLADIELHLGQYEAAERHLRSAWTTQRERLGADATDTLTAQANLARVLRELERGPEALELQRELVDVYRARDDEASLASALSHMGQTASSMGDFSSARAAYDEALRILEAIPVERRGPRTTLPALIADRASLLDKGGDLAGARVEYERALALYRATEGEVHPDIARVMGMLGMVTWDEGRLKEALAQMETVLEMQRQLFEGDHPDLANTLSCMGSLAVDLGSYAQAETRLREALAMRERLGQGEEKSSAIERLSLARALTALGKPTAAVPEIERAIASLERFAGTPDAERGDAYFQLALTRREQGALAASGVAARTALEIRRGLEPQNEEKLAQSISMLAQIHHSLKELDQAGPLYREARDRYVEAEGPRALNVAIADANLGSFELERGNLDEAETRLYAAVDVASDSFPPDHPSLATMRCNLARVLRRTERKQAAIELFEAALDAQRAKLPPLHGATIATLLELGETLLDVGRADAAEPPLREAYEGRKATPSTAPARLARAAESLGRCLAALERHADAEPLLLEAHASWTADGKSAEEVARVARSLAECYRALDRSADVERWSTASASK